MGVLRDDDFGRFHPFGTSCRAGLVHVHCRGCAVPLVIGRLAIVLSSLVATVVAMFSAYYRGSVDPGIVLVSDVMLALPESLVLVVTARYPCRHVDRLRVRRRARPRVLFAFTGWPHLWRAIVARRSKFRNVSGSKRARNGRDRRP